MKAKTGKPTTFAEYLGTLPEQRRVMMRELRSQIRKNLPAGYVERFDQRMLIYEVPLDVFPETYNGKPLMLAALASQRSFVTLYLMAIYGDESLQTWFREAYAASGKTLRMGKSCVHFRLADDIPLEVVGKAIGKVPVQEYIRIYKRARQGRRPSK